MSLSSLLLGQSKANAPKKSKSKSKSNDQPTASSVAIDNDLDALFRSSAVAFKSQPKPAVLDVSVTLTGPTLKTRKRRLGTGDESATEMSANGEEEERKLSKRVRISVPETAPVVQQSSKPRTKEKKKKQQAATQLSLEEDNDPELEDTYLSATKQLKKVRLNQEDASSSSEEGEAANSSLIHESLTGKRTRGPKTSKSKTKYVPHDETPAQRDARTIFVGNLSLQVAQKRTLMKQLHRHILTPIPHAKIESTRFRSVPFQNPTSKLTDDKDKTDSSSAKAPRQHDRDRMASWRENARQTHGKLPDDAGEGDSKSDEKVFLNPAQKKKIAFINQEFHPTADSVNAYIVFAYPIPPEHELAVKRRANLPPPPETMDPMEAARLAKEACDGSTFMERVIRVDLVGVGKSPSADFAAPVAEKEGDPKLSIFVGNLDFASKEEDVRIFFEGVVGAERGPPPEKTTWVTRVRIVRDRDTQMGKGFAYVQFSDRACVDDVLALDEVKLRFAKRKLRVQRCKIAKPAPPTSTTPTTPTKIAPGVSRPTTTTPIVVPKGDPGLGAKLVGMSKDERKEVKKANADRVQRRLLKKKARGALSVTGKLPLDVGSGKEKLQGRERKVGGKSGGHGKPAKVGRVRSEKSLGKRNAKK